MRAGRDLTVGLVGPLPPPAGGMANQCEQLARLLPDLGVVVTVVQTNRPWRPAWAGKIKGLRALFRLVPYLARLWSTAGRVDVFHVMANSGWSWTLFAAPAIVIAKMRGVPVLLNYRGGGAEAFLERSAWHVRPLVRRCDLFLVPSGFLVDVFAKFGMQAMVLPNIIDLTRFRHWGGSPPLKPTILVSRNLEEIYDVATALRAAARLKQDIWNLQVIVAGEGPLEADLKALATELGIAESVRFTGRVPNGEMPALYREASVMVNPSRVDNTPISILEALASGVPVVSTNVGGVPYLVEHRKSALLVNPGDPDAMAAAIAQAIGDPALREEMLAGGREVTRTYDWGTVGEQLVRRYRAIARQPDVLLSM